MPFRENVLERRRGDDRKADEEDVGLWIGERTKTIVVLLSSSIEKTQCVGLTTNHHCYSVVVKDLNNIQQERIKY